MIFELRISLAQPKRINEGCTATRIVGSNTKSGMGKSNGEGLASI